MAEVGVEYLPGQTSLEVGLEASDLQELAVASEPRELEVGVVAMEPRELEVAYSTRNPTPRTTLGEMQINNIFLFL